MAGAAAGAGAADTQKQQLDQRLKDVKHVILVLSGKGGVGKSTVATQLALALHATGARVGVLDVDLCGPSVPRMLGVAGSTVHQSTAGWVPVAADGEAGRLVVMSIGFLLGNTDQAVVWRGPKKTAMIRQFLCDVQWGPLDYLVVDTPPGTSDEHIALVELLLQRGVAGAVLVTTPQAVSVGDVRRELAFCRTIGLPVLGVAENMAGFVCPTCAECTPVFSSGGGRRLADANGIPYLGSVPLDPMIAQACDTGTAMAAYAAPNAASDNATVAAFAQLVQQLVQQLPSS